ncbi:serine hydrolase [Streptomyces sp. NPDC101234]|uniref:serine hydrolase n=1 Tax=Streptomyces sp. NPDC101234 TaxID=3366138 RepID=UPI003807376D
MVDDEIQEIFERSGCEGAMLVRSAADGAEFGLRADELVVPASVIKVLVALEAETRFADGSLDPRERVALGGRTGRPDRSASPCSRTMWPCPGGTWSSSC